MTETTFVSAPSPPGDPLGAHWRKRAEMNEETTPAQGAINPIMHPAFSRRALVQSAFLIGAALAPMGQALAAVVGTGSALTPFRIAVPQSELDDLKRRLDATRWPDKETVADDSQGPQLARVQVLVDYWRMQYGLPSPGSYEIEKQPDRFAGRLIRYCRASSVFGDDALGPLNGRRLGTKDTCTIGRLMPGDALEPASFVMPGWHFEADEAAQRSADADTCLPEGALKGAEAATIRVDQPSLSTQFGFDDEADAARLVSVEASSDGPALILILASDEPAIWDFRAFPVRRLRAVLLAAAHAQAVANLPQRMPIRYLTPGATDVACGSLLNNLTIRDGKALIALGEGLGLRTSARSDPDPAAINVDGGPAPRPSPARLRLADIRSAVPLVRDPVPPGVAGLAQLFASGAIRNATPHDAEIWQRVRSSPAGQTLNEVGTYVVTRAITVPREIPPYVRADFIIPPNVPIPVDRGSRLRYFSLADGTCKGGDACR